MPVIKYLTTKYYITTLTMHFIMPQYIDTIHDRGYIFIKIPYMTTTIRP